MASDKKKNINRTLPIIYGYNIYYLTIQKTIVKTFPALSLIVIRSRLSRMKTQENAEDKRHIKCNVYCTKTI